MFVFSIKRVGINTSFKQPVLSLDLAVSGASWNSDTCSKLCKPCTIFKRNSRLLPVTYICFFSVVVLIVKGACRLFTAHIAALKKSSYKFSVWHLQ